MTPILLNDLLVNSEIVLTLNGLNVTYTDKESIATLHPWIDANSLPMAAVSETNQYQNPKMTWNITRPWNDRGEPMFDKLNFQCCKYKYTSESTPDNM